jgi:ribosomal-protein-alanine N-acetyltransferase
MLRINFTPFPVLKTERLFLRQLQTEDANEIFLLRSDDTVVLLENKLRSKDDSFTDFIYSLKKLNE